MNDYGNNNNKNHVFFFRFFLLFCFAISLAAIYTKFEIETLVRTFNQNDCNQHETRIIDLNDCLDVGCYIELNANRMTDTVCATDDIPLINDQQDTKLTIMNDPDETTIALHEMRQSHAGWMCDEIDEHYQHDKKPLIKEEHSYANIHYSHALNIRTATDEETIDAPESFAIRKGNGTIAYQNRDGNIGNEAIGTHIKLEMKDIDLNDDNAMVVIEMFPLLEMMTRTQLKSAQQIGQRAKCVKRPNRPVKRFKCHECNYSTAGKKRLQVHVRYHTNEGPFKCGLCLKRFRLSGNLYSHMKFQCNDISHQCLRCLRGFADKIQLEVHEKECKKRIYQCFICKDFNDAYKRNLIRHMRIHNRCQ